jgi:hypothetical protein
MRIEYDISDDLVEELVGTMRCPLSWRRGHPNWPLAVLTVDEMDSERVVAVCSYCGFKFEFERWKLAKCAA